MLDINLYLDNSVDLNCDFIWILDHYKISERTLDYYDSLDYDNFEEDN